MNEDPFARALRDLHFGTRREPLLQCDGDEALEHPFEAFYLGEFDPSTDCGRFLERWLDGPLLDMGAGVGRDAQHV